MKKKYKTIRSHLVIVEIHDGLLQVPDSPVDELGASTRGAAREVVQLHQAGLTI